MSGTVHITSSDFWVKVVGMLQQNWAVIELEAAGGARTYFINDTSGVFDQLTFHSASDAANALQRNGFRRYATASDLHSFLQPPSGPYERRAHPNGPIYSSGRCWKK